jgi:hypothetical protein
MTLADMEARMTLAELAYWRWLAQVEHSERDTR